MNENEKKFYILLIIFFFLLAWAKSAWGKVPTVYVGFQNYKAEDAQYLLTEWNKRFNKIVKLELDNGNIAKQGGIYVNRTMSSMGFVGNTQRTTAYNVNLEEIIVWQVTINDRVLNLYDEANYANAYYNTHLHEMACHALVNGADHTAWGLCKPGLSTDKIYWGKRHRRYLQKHLFTDFKTGNILQ